MVVSGPVSAVRTLASALVAVLVAVLLGAAPADSAQVPPSVFRPDVAELSADVGQTFSEFFVFDPGNQVGPVQFQLVGGALPPGLQIVVPCFCMRPVPAPPQQNFVRITGIPTQQGAFAFTLRARDRNGLESTRSWTIRVGPPLPLAITPQAWGPLEVARPQNLFVDGTGGVLPYRWAVTAGALPPGLALVQDSATVGLVRVGGTPTAAGAASFTLGLTDALGATLSRTFTVTVAGPVTPTLEEVAVTPTTTAGSTVVATVRLTPPSASGTTVGLASSAPAVAGVPASVTVAPGDTVGAFPVTSASVSVSTPVTITATLAGQVRTTTLTVTPATAPPTSPPAAADTVTISRADYDAGKRELRVSAASNRAGATLTAVSAGGVRLGTVAAGGSVLTGVTVNPQSITVTSSLGGSATRVVTVK